MWKGRNRSSAVSENKVYKYKVNHRFHYEKQLMVELTGGRGGGAHFIGALAF